MLSTKFICYFTNFVQRLRFYGYVILTKMPTIGEPTALVMEYKANTIPNSLCPIPLWVAYRMEVEL